LSLLIAIGSSHLLFFTGSIPFPIVICTDERNIYYHTNASVHDQTQH